MYRICALLAVTAVSAALSPSALLAQADAPAGQEAEQQPEVKLPTIADEPKAIDPGELLPDKLAARATQDFSDSSLREVVAWLREQQGLVVLVDANSLDDIGVSSAEPISDRLDDDPLYLLLNRLRSMGLGWYYDDDVLYITSVEVAEERTVTLPYNVGDLLDADYDLDRLVTVIVNTIAPDSWEEVGGVGALNSLGDVLFVRHSSQHQRSVEGLLQALRKHGRQTFLNDPPQHGEIRETLAANVSVTFEDTPLEAAVAQLAARASSDIRLDRPALREVRIREREPVTLELADRKLTTVLQAMVLDLDMTWIIRDGVLWVTSAEEAERFLRTAVYDVRDLCRDAGESQALIEAIVSQAEPDSWSEVGGPGAIESAKPGTLVVTHQEQVHRQVLGLLETYRGALRASKPRNRGAERGKEVATVYYRVHAKVAEDLSGMLPVLVRPDTWQGDEAEEDEDRPGRIYVVASTPDLTGVGRASPAADSKQPAATAILERSVLIIRQTRAAHDEIAEVIGRVEAGDGIAGKGGMLGGGMGGGGFGGGFFAVPATRASKPAR